MIGLLRPSLHWLESNTIGAVNAITLGQIMSDHNKQMITLTDFPFLLNKPTHHLTGLDTTGSKWW